FHSASRLLQRSGRPVVFQRSVGRGHFSEIFGLSFSAFVHGVVQLVHPTAGNRLVPGVLRGNVRHFLSQLLVQGFAFALFPGSGAPSGDRRPLLGRVDAALQRIDGHLVLVQAFGGLQLGRIFRCARFRRRLV